MKKEENYTKEKGTTSSVQNRTKDFVNKEDKSNKKININTSKLAKNKIKQPNVQADLNEKIKKPNLQEELNEYKNKYYRAIAESDNLRKRLQQEKEEMLVYIVNSLLCDFLQPLDALEHALSYTDGLSKEIKCWSDGFKMIVKQFLAIYDNYGAKSFESLGKPFDSQYHEAIETVESDQPENTVVEEVTKGYTRNNLILRHAKVTISKNKTKKTENQNKEEKNNG